MADLLFEMVGFSVVVTAAVLLLLGVWLIVADRVAQYGFLCVCPRARRSQDGGAP